MQIKFRSETGYIEATINISDNTLDKETAERCVKSVLNHLSAHLKTHCIPEVFEHISKTRREFFDKVLHYLVNVARKSNVEIPEEVQNHVSKDAGKDWFIPDET